MQKFLVGAIALALLLPATAKAQEPDSLCYMVSGSGRLVNLGSLCGNQGSNVTPPPTSSRNPTTVTLPRPAALSSNRYLDAGESDGYRFFIDKESIKRTSQGFNYEIIGINQYAMAKARFSINCSTLKRTLNNMDVYDLKGNFVSNLPIKWSAENDGSPTSQKYAALCQYISQAP